jgi:hypothetical protein
VIDSFRRFSVGPVDLERAEPTIGLTDAGLYRHASGAARLKRFQIEQKTCPKIPQQLQ